MKHLKPFSIFEARLPETHEELNTIANMKVGEVGWVVSWAMKVDMDGECYLWSEYTVSKEKAGTVQLKIKRVEDGFIAYIHDVKDTKYRREVIKVDVLPVVAFDDTHIPKKDSLEDLQQQLTQALEDEDYKKAAIIKAKIERLK